MKYQTKAIRTAERKKELLRYRRLSRCSRCKVRHDPRACPYYGLGKPDICESYKDPLAEFIDIEAEKQAGYEQGAGV